MDGRGWRRSMSVAALAAGLSCGPGQDEVALVDACAEQTHGSVGCSFTLTRLLHLRANEDDLDAIIVSNPSTDTSARVQLLRSGHGDGPVELGPGEVHVFDLGGPSIGGQSSARESNAAVHVVASSPVAAYLLAPLANRTSNDGSVLLPDAALGDAYVISSYRSFYDPNHPQGGGEPSYFTVVGRVDGTEVRFRPPVDTASAHQLEAVAAGDEGVFEIDADEAVRVAAVPLSDISGTVVESSAPIWVAGAVGCAYVPVLPPGSCDHMQELMRPIADWGRDIPAVPAPERANEPQIWRVYAGADEVSVTTEPAVPGAPFVLDTIGDWFELTVVHGQTLWFHADGPIMAVQYLVSRHLAGGRGDPSMIQAAPTSAWLSRYVISTGVRYSEHFAQIVRAPGSADVYIDGFLVLGYHGGPGLEIVDVAIPEGAHVIDSAGPFGLSVFGYSNAIDGTKFTSYAFPGGYAP